MEIKSAINVFDSWAHLGKDKGMDKGHAASVDRMFEILADKFSNNKINSALDLGCGNGWLLRKINSKFPKITRMGIDGSGSMINKAKEIDPRTEYQCIDINNWIPNRKFDLIMSMEVMYYLKNPIGIINSIVNK